MNGLLHSVHLSKPKNLLLKGPFWVKCGMEEESVKGFIGLKTIQELKSLGENTLYWNNEIPDVPEMKTGIVIKEGLRFELTFPGIGTVKVRYHILQIISIREV